MYQKTGNQSLIPENNLAYLSGLQHITEDITALY